MPPEKKKKKVKQHCLHENFTHFEFQYNNPTVSMSMKHVFQNINNDFKLFISWETINQKLSLHCARYISIGSVEANLPTFPGKRLKYDNQISLFLPFLRFLRNRNKKIKIKIFYKIQVIDIANKNRTTHQAPETQNKQSIE